MWLISPNARPAGEPPVGYAQLGRWLARVIKPGKLNLRQVESTGREIGRELAPDGACTAEAKMHATLVSLGFQPRREANRAGVLTYRLCNCPYREAVRQNADVVCALHRGITRGLLDEIDPTSTLCAFLPRDPSLAGCLIELSGEIAAEGLEQLQNSTHP
jgi:predicted hydrocarbon binding protein